MRSAGRTGTATRLSPTVSHAITPPNTAITAQMRNATATFAVSTPGRRVVSRCTIDGSTATERSPARRDTALFTPDAIPSSASVTELSTVDVSGATVADRPRPNTITAGRTVVT